MKNFELDQRGKIFLIILVGGFLVVALTMEFNGILLPGWLIACVKFGCFLAMMVWFFKLVDRQ